MSKKDEEVKKEDATPFENTQGDSAESESEVLEYEFNDDGEEDLKKTLKKFRADLKVCKKEKEEYLLGWQKERADFVNYKKQEEERKINFSEITREHILSRFLTVIDSFNMAFANREAWEKVDANWRIGVEYIYTQMNNIFEEYGVKPIGEIGEVFDPNFYQSINMIQTDKKENDHTIAEVIQKGYKFGTKVIRAARVNIFEYKE